MAATGLQVNWDDVSFTPTSGSAIPITRVTNVTFGARPDNIKFKGDDAHYDQVVVNVNSTQTATVNSGDSGTVMGLPGGAVGVFTATHLDALGAAGGDIIYELDCIVGARDSAGGHGQFGTASVTFDGFSTDGVTNPLSFTRA